MVVQPVFATMRRRRENHMRHAALPQRHGSVFGMSSRLAIVGRLWRSLGQAPTSAKSESEGIHFVTPCHRRETNNERKESCFHGTLLSRSEARANGPFFAFFTLVSRKHTNINSSWRLLFSLVPPCAALPDQAVALLLRLFGLWIFVPK